MSDPFDRLRDGVPTVTPDVGAIRARARGIQRRRYLMLGSSATVIAIVAIVGVFIARPQTMPDKTAAQGTTQRTSSGASELQGGSAATKGAPGAAPDQRGQQATAYSEKSVTTAAGAVRSQAPPTLDVTLDAKSRTPHGATFTLKACNKSTQTIERTFNTSQRYDFEVKRSGTLVWRWSDGMAFAQVVGTERWKAGECKTWTAEWNGTNSMGAPASPGTYQAVGVLTSSPEQRTKPKDICLDLC